MYSVMLYLDLLNVETQTLIIYICDQCGINLDNLMWFSVLVIHKYSFSSLLDRLDHII